MRSGSISARGPAKKKHQLLLQPLSARESHFSQMIEHTLDAFAASDDSAVEDVRKILADIRKQYDDVHNASEKKEEELHRLREAIRQADASTCIKSDEIFKLEDTRQSLLRQIEDTNNKIAEATTNKKVYLQMLERIKKEHSILQQKMTKMETHLARKNKEYQEKLEKTRKQQQQRVQTQTDLELLERDVAHERSKRDAALAGMLGSLQTKKNAIKRRADFERWRHEVALEAANEAFNASAGRLRKLWAVEKLAGNCLQKVIFDQVEKSQATEDGFQKIREVTGLTDVMDIVHKFLNREVEQNQLRQSVAEAEARLEALKEEHERYRRETDGITFATLTAAIRARQDSQRRDKKDAIEAATSEGLSEVAHLPELPLDVGLVVAGAAEDCQASVGGQATTRTIYLEIEKKEKELTRVTREHHASRARLQRATLQLEQVRRWADRVNKSFRAFEEPKYFDAPAGAEAHRSDEDLVNYFKELAEITVPRFLSHIQQQVASGKAQKKTAGQVLAKDLSEQAKLLNDKDFNKANCRVQISREGGRVHTQGDEEDEDMGMGMDREKFKSSSNSRVNEALKRSMRHGRGKSKV